jgi:polysaccharide chain length determinant protein (PEP-CTERM system associated)
MIGPLITLVRNEARRIWCFRWLVAATTILLWCAAGAYIQRLPSTYDAWGQIYVPQQTPLAVAAEGVSLVGNGYGSPHVVQTTLLNDDNLEKIVRRIEPQAASKGAAALAAAVNRLRGKIRRAPDPGDGFIELHVTDTDAVRARDVVRLLMEQFIASNIGRSQRDLGRAGEFLDEQITSYDSMIEASQANIAAFRRSHPEVAFVTLTTGRAGIGQEAGYIEAAPAGERQAFAAEPATGPRDVAAPAPSPAERRVAELEARLALLRTTYTDRYPDVVATRRQLADATAARDDEQGVAGSSKASKSAAASRPRGDQTGARRSAPRRLAALPPPEVMAAWADLQKADELLRANYQQLLAKRAATQMSQAVYRDDEGGKYQIVRQPTVPVIPTGPNRPLYFGAAVLLSIGAGVAVGYLRAAMKGILVSRQELEEAFQLPVIGTVSWEPAWHTSRPEHGWLTRGAWTLPRWPRTRRTR